MPDDELKAAVAEFLGAFEEVFGHDWEWTKSRFTLPLKELYFKAGANFLEPGVADEQADWGARGILLDKYRSLRQVLERLGVHPIPPAHHYRSS